MTHNSNEVHLKKFSNLAFLILIFSLSLGPAYSEVSTYCQRISSNKKKSIGNRVQVERLVEQFALDFKIRGISENMLSRLIAAKSPMIFSFVKKRNLDPEKNPEKVALEWDKYYAKLFIIGRYSEQEVEIKLKIEQLFKVLFEKSYPKMTRDKFENALKDAKKWAKETILKFPISIDDKNIIDEKINSIQLYFPTELKGSRFEQFPLDVLEWSLSYDQNANAINVGFQALDIDERNLKIILLHEIAHAFDSCRWGQKELRSWPFDKIGLCLREFAQPRDDSKLDLFYQDKKINQADYEKLKKHSTCNNSIYPPEGIQADQLPETFADWFAAEAIPEVEISSNFRRDLCDESNNKVGSSYLSYRERLGSVFFAQPKISSKLHVQSKKAKYCTF